MSADSEDRLHTSSPVGPSRRQSVIATRFHDSCPPPSPETMWLEASMHSDGSQRCMLTRSRNPPKMGASQILISFRRVVGESNTSSYSPVNRADQREAMGKPIKTGSQRVLRPWNDRNQMHARIIPCLFFQAFWKVELVESGQASNANSSGD